MYFKKKLHGFDPHIFLQYLSRPRLVLQYVSRYAFIYLHFGFINVVYFTFLKLRASKIQHFGDQVLRFCKTSLYACFRVFICKLLKYLIFDDFPNI